MVVPKPPDVFRIMCYGDSNTDGYDRGSWPEQLEKLLNERSTGSHRYEVVNAGVVGYSSHQGLLRFRGEVERYRPNMVIVSFGWNDAADIGGRRPDSEYQLSAWRVTFLRVVLRSRLFLVFMHYFGDRRVAPPHVHAARVPLVDYLRNMKSFADTASQHGASVVYLTRPHREQEAKLRLLEYWERDVALYNARLRLWADEQALPLIDIQKLFAISGREWFADKSHFTLPGHRLMAKTLLMHLAQRRLIPGITTAIRQ